MKKLFILFMLATLALTSCKKDKELTIEELIDSGNLEEIKKRKAELQAKNEAERKAIEKLNQEVVALDPEVKNYALVTAIEPVDTLFNHFIEVQGSVKTKDDRMITAELGGTLTNLNVREGEYIKKGQLIGIVDDGGINEQIAQQKVQLELAKINYERQKYLWDQNIGTEMQYITAKKNYEALQEGVNYLERQLTRAKFYAPYSGIVEEIMTEQGQVVGPGVPIIRLISLGSLFVEAEVPENYLAQVRKGTRVQVRLDAIDKEYMTTVKSINSTINPTSRAFVIEVGVPKSNLIKPNLNALLRINDYTNKDALLIPSDIISENPNGEQYVFVVEDEQDGIATVKQSIVEIGQLADNNLVEILSGLTANQKVIAEGAKTLSDGQEVQILPMTEN